MFKLCELTEGHPLYYSGTWLIERTDLLPKFRISLDKFKSWLLMMENEYSPLPYHNRIHAADVLQAFNFAAFNGQWANKFTPIEKLSALIAAVGHDIHHTGLSNQFLVKSRNPMAIMYSDSSVNEFHHSAHMFSTTLASEYNIFADLTTEEYEEVRRIAIKLIIATDMGKHFEILTKFKTKMQDKHFSNLESQENRLMVLEIALKCGDLNNPSKPQEVSFQWSMCVMEEFYRQGDKERELGLPVSNFMDRKFPNVAKCQVGFIDLLVAPLFNTWISFNHDDLSNTIMKHNITYNKIFWQQVAIANQQENESKLRKESLVAKSLSSMVSSIAVNKPAKVPDVPRLPEIYVLQSSDQRLPADDRPERTFSY
ncbi:hypothetical protein BC830DRAFT_761143 [Chytriomyces sp. MP71]|nr:hypothetical protein BC830DRAFT_761143 [Chytriomyces sp. MP71]